MSLSHSIDQICLEHGGSRADRIASLEEAILAAAKKAWGEERLLEAQFDEEGDVVLVFQAVRVVEHVGPSRETLEIDLATAQSLGAELGEELVVQIHYRDEDAEAAALRDDLSRVRPSLDVLAAGLPFDGPEWMRPLWPHRRYPGLFKPLPSEIPSASLEETLDALQSWLRSAAPSLQLAPASEVDLAEAGRLGPFARDLVALHRRFAATPAADPLTMDELPLLSFREARSLSHKLGQLDARLARLLPLFMASVEDGYLLDLTDGRVMHWYLDEGELSAHAPSLHAWMGFLVEGAQRGLLRWEAGRGIVPAGDGSGVGPLIQTTLFRLKQLAGMGSG